MKWVSVKKKLPRNDTVVSILTTEDDEGTAHYLENRFRGRRNDGMILLGVSHWRYRDRPAGRRSIHQRRRLNTSVKRLFDQRSEEDRRS